MRKLLKVFTIFASMLVCLLSIFQVTPTAHAENITSAAYPSDLIIPSINLISPIQGVGINSYGEMAVPDGKTNRVGWYQYGTIPGNIGSAVIDAHVFAAFAKLKYVKPGSDIYVLTQQKSLLHFVVSRVQTYSIAKVPLNILFNQSNGKYLNLITCAGELTRDHSTYDSRLVVYAERVG